MKRLSFITGGIAALLVIFAAIGALCSAVVSEAADESLYGVRSRQAVMQEHGFATEEEAGAYIGISATEQDEFARRVARNMRQRDAAFDEEILGENERQHMRDVRDLILGVDWAAKTMLWLTALLGVALTWLAARLERRWRVVLAGLLSGAAVLALVGIAAGLLLFSGGFERLFIGMHELLFHNDLWRMNPQTDILIRMMPQGLFEQAACRALAQAGGTFAVLMTMLGVIHVIIGNMIRRQLTEKNHDEL